MRTKTDPHQSQRAAPYAIAHKSTHSAVGILGNTKTKDAPSQLVVSIKRTMTANREKVDAAKALLSLRSAPVYSSEAKVALTQSTSTTPITTTVTRTIASPSALPAAMAISTSELPSSSFIKTSAQVIAGIPPKYNVAKVALTVGLSGSGLVLATRADSGFCYLLYHANLDGSRIGVKQIPSGLTTRALNKLHVTEEVRASYERAAIDQLTSS